MRDDSGGSPTLEQRMRQAPDRAGVYVFKSARGGVIYVGKASSLRQRLHSYLQRDHPDAKTRALLRDAEDLELILVENDVEALLLERSMIKHHGPKYNIKLRDDKQYPLLRIDLSEDWPRLERVRQRRDDDATYLGPFASATALRTILQATHRVFPLIKCSRQEFKQARRPCTYYHMKACLGPCTLPVEGVRYRAMVEDAVQFLQGRNKEVETSLKKRMKEAAAAEQFEVAATYRDQLAALESITAEQVVVLSSDRDLDAIALVEREGWMAFAVMLVRRGRMVHVDGYLTEGAWEQRGSALRQFLLGYYDGREVPREILLSEPVEDAVALSSVLGLEGTRPRLIVPQRGERRALVERACKNAEFHLEESGKARIGSRRSLEALRDFLGVSFLPRRIECVDISNLQDQARVASCVCWIDGAPAKDQYRRYRIRTVEGQDDFGSIEEVVGRRLRRAAEEGEWPDLMVIDGGLGQLNAAIRAANIADPMGRVMIVALAKSRIVAEGGAAQAENASSGPPVRTEERVFFAGQRVPVPLVVGSPEYRVLCGMRDEAHRFALAYHRRRRLHEATSSVLDDVRGVGPKLRQRLMQRFGGLDGLRRASLDALCRVPGVSEALAVAIKARLGEEGWGE